MKGVLKNRLAECRAAKKINKSQLALRLGKSRAYVTRLERGDIRPCLAVALFLGRYFKQPVEEIFQLMEEGAAQSTISRPVSAASGNKQQTTPGP